MAQQAFRLLDLPTELRLQILEDYFAAAMPTHDDSPSATLRTCCGTKDSYTRFLQGVPILHTCRQLRAEGRKFFMVSLNTELEHRLSSMKATRALAQAGSSADKTAQAFSHASQQLYLVRYALKGWRNRGQRAALRGLERERNRVEGRLYRQCHVVLGYM